MHNGNTSCIWFCWGFGRYRHKKIAEQVNKIVVDDKQVTLKAKHALENKQNMSINGADKLTKAEVKTALKYKIKRRWG